jgi:hypothetical protein
MDYAEALKKVQAFKSKDNYMAIKLSYECKMVLPYKDGVAFIQALNSAETLKEPYSEQHRITPFDRSSIEVTLLSNEEYVRIKVAALLGVKPSEVPSLEAAT